jgi:hypothetical protein
VKVAAYDARALLAVNGEEKTYLELAAKDLDVTAAEVEKLPLAQVVVDKGLSLSKGGSTRRGAAHGHVPERRSWSRWSGQEGRSQRGRLRHHRGQAGGPQGLVVREGRASCGEARRRRA